MEAKDQKMDGDFPKVLVISGEPFNMDNATGITLSNLFKGWDKNRLAQIYINDSGLTDGICVNYFHWNPKNAFIDFYIRKVVSWIKKENEDTSAPAGVPLDSRDRTIKSWAHLNLRAFADFSPIFFSSNLYKWIKEFNPDIIYCMLGSVRMIKLATTIAQKTDKPLVPHFMDDWLSTLYIQNELLGNAKLMLKKKVNKMFSLVRGGLCISTLMAEEYSSRYNLPFAVFGNTVDDVFLQSSNFKPKENPFVFMYVGGLHLSRWESLLDISKAIEDINKNGCRVLLKIYSPDKDIKAYNKFFNEFPSTKFVRSLKSEEIFLTLKDADILVHVESFDRSYASFIKYSLSTKIPQYMAAGRPILAYGPPGIASIEHIRQVNAGVAILERDYQSLVQNIELMISDVHLLGLYANNGFEYAKNEYSKANNLTEFVKTIKLSSK